MRPLDHAEFLTGAAAYATATVLFFLHLTGRGRASRLVWVAPWLLGLGALAHLGHLAATGLARHGCPLLELDTALSLAAVATVLAYLAVLRGRLQALGAFVAPVALSFLVAAEFASTTEAAMDQPALLAVHVAANLGGLGVFLVAGAMSALYLSQERRLKSKRPPRTRVRLPPLDVLDVAAHRLVLVGFPLLTVGIVTGAMFSGGLDTGAPLDLARVVLTYVAWGVVAAALVLRSIAGWRGRRAAWAALIGAASVLLVLLGYLLRPVLGGGP